MINELRNAISSQGTSPFSCQGSRWTKRSSQKGVKTGQFCYTLVSGKENLAMILNHDAREGPTRESFASLL